MNVDDDDEVFIISNRTRERSGLTRFLKYHHSSSSSYSCVCSGRDVLPPNASNTKVCREDEEE